MPDTSDLHRVGLTVTALRSRPRPHQVGYRLAAAEETP
jgi:hypothetical protein